MWVCLYRYIPTQIRTPINEWKGLFIETNYVIWIATFHASFLWMTSKGMAECLRLNFSEGSHFLNMTKFIYFCLFRSTCVLELFLKFSVLLLLLFQKNTYSNPEPEASFVLFIFLMGAGSRWKEDLMQKLHNYNRLSNFIK